MGTEPVAISTAIKEAISAGVKVLVIFGVVVWSGEQTAAVMLAVDSILAIVIMVWQLRSRVTSIAAPRVPAGSTVTSYDPATGADIGTVTAPTEPAPAVAEAPPPAAPGG